MLRPIKCYKQLNLALRKKYLHNGGYSEDEIEQIECIMNVLNKKVFCWIDTVGNLFYSDTNDARDVVPCSFEELVAYCDTLEGDREDDECEDDDDVWHNTLIPLTESGDALEIVITTMHRFKHRVVPQDVPAETMVSCIRNTLRDKKLYAWYSTEGYLRVSDRDDVDDSEYVTFEELYQRCLEAQ